jgi:hypothetical protein
MEKSAGRNRKYFPPHAPCPLFMPFVQALPSFRLTAARPWKTPRPAKALSSALAVGCGDRRTTLTNKGRETMKTRITELFGIERPIIQGGMHYVGFAELAAAVSNAGGLGIITGLTQPSGKHLAEEIRRAQAMTDKPIGVNLTFLPAVTPPDYPGYIDAIIEAGVKVVETAGNNPAKWLPRLQDAGIKVIHKCTSVRHALKAESIGCDAGIRARTTCPT